MINCCDAHLVDREPDGGKGDEPEEEEAHKVTRSDARGLRQVIG